MYDDKYLIRIAQHLGSKTTSASVQTGSWQRTGEQVGKIHCQLRFRAQLYRPSLKTYCSSASFFPPFFSFPRQFDQVSGRDASGRRQDEKYFLPWCPSPLASFVQILLSGAISPYLIAAVMSASSEKNKFDYCMSSTSTFSLFFLVRFRDFWHCRLLFCFLVSGILANALGNGHRPRSSGPWLDTHEQAVIHIVMPLLASSTIATHHHTPEGGPNLFFFYSGVRDFSLGLTMKAAWSGINVSWWFILPMLNRATRFTVTWGTCTLLLMYQHLRKLEAGNCAWFAVSY